MDLAEQELLRGFIRDVKDFPSVGILFKDITPLLLEPIAFQLAISGFSNFTKNCDLIAGVEARGFIFASALAHATGKGFIPIRKSGKLPAATLSQSYSLEYGRNTLQMHRDALSPGDRVLIIDDVLATGGTLVAASQLVEQCGGLVCQVGVLMEIEGLAGRENFAQAFPDILISALI